MEQWRAIEGFDRYEVSDMGRVRNLGGYFVRAGKVNGVRIVDAKVLKPFVAQKTGYMQVLLPDRRKHSVHRLVAKAFCDGMADGLVVDHINGDRADNRASNLRWVSASFNVSRPYAEGRIRGWASGLQGDEAPKTTAIVGRRISDGMEQSWPCAIDAVRELGLDSGSISRCCYGKYKSHKGWEFRFADGVTGFPWKRTAPKAKPKQREEVPA